MDLALISQLSPVPSSHIRRIVDESGSRLFVYVEEASIAYGWSAELLARVQEHAGPDRPNRHERIGAVYSPIPSSRDLERQALPQVDDIVTRVLECF